MAYRDIIAHIEDIQTSLAETSDPTDGLYSAQPSLEALLDEAPRLGVERTSDRAVIDRFQKLGGALREVSARVDAEELTWRVQGLTRNALALCDEIAARKPTSNGAEAGELFDGDEILGMVGAGDFPDVVERADRELLAAPGSVLARFARACALALMGRHGEALAETIEMTEMTRARHVMAPGAYAALLAGQPDTAVSFGLEGLHRRLGLERPESWLELDAPPEISGDDAHHAQLLLVELVQTGTELLNEHGVDEGLITLIVGLTAPNLQQCYADFLQPLAEERADDLNAAQRGALFGAMSRIERWLTDFESAKLWGDRARELGVFSEWLDAEEGFRERDLSLLGAGQVALTCGESSLTLFRTATRTGVTLNGEEPVTQTTPHPERTPEQVADIFKDQVVAWIDSGFTHTIEVEGPLEGDDEDEVFEDDEPDDGIDGARVTALHTDGDLDGLIALADEHLEVHPHSAAAQLVRCMAHLMSEELDEALADARAAVAASSCRATHCALVAIKTLLEIDQEEPDATLSGPLDAALDSVSSRLRSQTPDVPDDVELDGFGVVTPGENELLDSLEGLFFNALVIELTDEDGMPVNAPASVLLAMMTPNPSQSIERLNLNIMQLEGALEAREEGSDELTVLEEFEDSVGEELIAIAVSSVARWRRYSDDFDGAHELLHEYLSGSRHACVTLERARLERDVRLLEKTSVTLRGFGTTLTITRSEDRIAQEWQSGDHIITASGLYGVDTPDELAIPMKDSVVGWLESGFELV